MATTYPEAANPLSAIEKHRCDTITYFAKRRHTHHSRAWSGRRRSPTFANDAVHVGKHPVRRVGDGSASSTSTRMIVAMSLRGFQP